MDLYHGSTDILEHAVAAPILTFRPKLDAPVSIHAPALSTANQQELLKIELRLCRTNGLCKLSEAYVEVISVRERAGALGHLEPSIKFV